MTTKANLLGGNEVQEDPTHSIQNWLEDLTSASVSLIKFFVSN